MQAPRKPAATSRVKMSNTSATMVSDLSGAAEAGERSLPRRPEQDDLVRLRRRALNLHARRADWHPRDGEALARRPLGEQPLDCRRRHVALDDVATDLSRMAGRE